MIYHTRETFPLREKGYRNRYVNRTIDYKKEDD
jgi:hypothetical protein